MPPNSLTQAYLNYNRVEHVNADDNRASNNDLRGTYQPSNQAIVQNRVSMQELCRQQLQENLRNDQERRQARTMTKQAVTQQQQFQRSQNSISPTDYRGRGGNGSPLRQSK